MNKGKTPSSNTGPNSAAQGSRYAYIETSGRSQGQKASFISKYMFESKNEPELQMGLCIILVGFFLKKSNFNQHYL